MQSEKITLPIVLHGGGRPSKLTQQLVERAMMYVIGGYQETDLREVVPTIAGLSMYLGVSRSIVNQWASDAKDEPDNDLKQQFLDIAQAIKAKQEIMLVSGGLRGDFNPTIAKLLLHKHGYKDEAKTALTDANGGNVGFTLVAIDDGTTPIT